MLTSEKYTHIINVCTAYPLKSPTQHTTIEYAQPCTYEPMYWVLCAYIHVLFMYALTLHTMSIYVLYMHKFICLFFVLTQMWTNVALETVDVHKYAIMYQVVIPACVRLGFI